MTGTDVPKRQFYARKAKTSNAHCRFCDIVDVGTKKRRIDSRARPVVGDSETLHTDDNRDRISNLPRDLRHWIVKRLSIHDAARTSILSKDWRYIWGMNTRLVLDESFFSQLTFNKDKERHQAVFLRAVEMIMVVHISPILTLNLYIPPKLNQFLVSQWIEHFLKKGVRDIELTNSEKNAYEIPSCLFNCAGLTHLKLNAWIFNPPYKFTHVTNLTWLDLTYTSFNADISFGTQLKYLSLLHCTGIEHLGCQFTNGNNLTMLRLTASEQIDWRWLECTKKLKFFGLELTAVSNIKKSINLITLLSNIPSLYGLYISAFTLEVLGQDLTVMKEIAAKVENVGSLMFSQLGSHNLRQISYSLCLIRCLPKLKVLEIILDVEVKSLNPNESTSNLQSDDWKDMSLRQLETVKIHGLVGSNYVFQFIKVLLASSPWLGVMSLFFSSEANIDPNEKLQIKQKLQRFPRRSFVADMIFH